MHTNAVVVEDHQATSPITIPPWVPLCVVKGIDTRNSHVIRQITFDHISLTTPRGRLNNTEKFVHNKFTLS